MFCQQLRRQRFCGFRYNLNGPFGCATHCVAVPVRVKADALQRRRHTLDFIANVKQPKLRALACGH
jgi:hypothetical protein